MRWRDKYDPINRGAQRIFISKEKFPASLTDIEDGDFNVAWAGSGVKSELENNGKELWGDISIRRIFFRRMHLVELHVVEIISQKKIIHFVDGSLGRITFRRNRKFYQLLEISFWMI